MGTTRILTVSGVLALACSLAFHPAVQAETNEQTDHLTNIAVTQAMMDFAAVEQRLAEKWIVLEQQRAALAKEPSALAIEEQQLANKRTALEQRRLALAQEINTLALEEVQLTAHHAPFKYDATTAKPKNIVDAGMQVDVIPVGSVTESAQAGHKQSTKPTLATAKSEGAEKSRVEEQKAAVAQDEAQVDKEAAVVEAKQAAVMEQQAAAAQNEAQAAVAEQQAAVVEWQAVVAQEETQAETENSGSRNN